MNGIIPRGYISVREALNRLGRELFPSEWTGEERRARRGLISRDDWLKTKDLPRARGSGAPGSGAMPGKTRATPVTATPHQTGDPSDPEYQAEYRANKRYEDARGRLQTLLEAGDRETAILDPWTGNLHRASTALWRRSDAGRMIKEGRAPIPHSPNTGELLVKEFRETIVPAPAKPLPQAKLGEMVKALREKVATENLTRPQQKDFVRKTFPNHRVTDRQFNKIFQSVPGQIGRPKKSHKKV
jgi:hypothetical protein